MTDRYTDCRQTNKRENEQTKNQTNMQIARRQTERQTENPANSSVTQKPRGSHLPRRSHTGIVGRLQSRN